MRRLLTYTDLKISLIFSLIFVCIAFAATSVFSDPAGKITAREPKPIGPNLHITTEEISSSEPASLPPQISHPEPLATSLEILIEGINIDRNRVVTDFFFIPPDPIGAAGPDHIVSVVNTSIEWFTKDGIRENSQRLGRNASGSISGSFFEPLQPANATFDPKVIYDQYAGRFLVVTLEQLDTFLGDPVNRSRILLAVSDDSDPNGTWFFHAINAKTTISGIDHWADYPGFAVGEKAVYITNNLFSFFSNGANFGGVRLWIIDKGEKTGFYAGGKASSTIHDPYETTGFPLTTQPSHMFGVGPTDTGTFLVSYGGLSDGTNEFVQVVRLGNPLNNPSFSHQFVNAGDIENAIAFFPDAPQRGSNSEIETNDRRALNAVWRDDALWMTAEILPATGPDANEVTAHWWKLDTTNLTSIAVEDQGNVGGEDIAPGTFTFFPSIAVDGMGNMGIGFAASAPTIFPGAYFTGRLSTDPKGAVQPTKTLATGQAFYLRTFGNGRNRWGDYSGIAVDPKDDATFWVFNEYALPRGSADSTGEDGRWGTRFGNFSLDGDEQIFLEQTSLIRGQETLFRVTGAERSEQVYFIFSATGIQENGGPCPDSLGGLCVDLLEPAIFSNEFTDANGTVLLTFPIPSNAPVGTQVYTQAVIPRGTESVKSNVVANTISQ